MAITVLGLWEDAWMESARTERRIWKQTIQAFGVNRWVMVSGEPGEFTSPDQYQRIEDALSSLGGERVFLIAPRSYDGGIELVDFKHPDNACYIFGDSVDNLVRYVRPKDHVVSLTTPMQSSMFGHTVLCSVLYDRLVKQ